MLQRIKRYSKSARFTQSQSTGALSEKIQFNRYAVGRCICHSFPCVSRTAMNIQPLRGWATACCRKKNYRCTTEQISSLEVSCSFVPSRYFLKSTEKRISVGDWYERKGKRRLMRFRLFVQPNITSLTPGGNNTRTRFFRVFIFLLRYLFPPFNHPFLEKTNGIRVNIGLLIVLNVKRS